MNQSRVPELSPMTLARRLIFALLALAFVVLAVRLLPYLVPIRAASIAQHQQSVEFTDRGGLVLGTLLTRDQEHTVAVPLSAVAPNFIHAVIAAEDSRYARHGPVDYLAMARAAWQSVRSRRIVSGASTITMQLARMVRPSPSTALGKLSQIWTAWRLAAGMTREEILSAYVNRVPMGGNVYGVEAAARTYLGLPAADLDLSQASLLAAIPNDPNGLYPYEHWGSLKIRQGYVLERMRKDGYITADQAQRAAAEHVSLRPRGQGIVAAPHFLFWLASQLPDGTAKIRTTIDRGLQQFVEEQVVQVTSGLASRNVHHAAVVVVDNHTGQVLAYVGSPDYFSEVQMGRNDGAQALRQPGSALKPFLYELALENRTIHPNTILADVPTHYAIPGGLLYSPVDYNGNYQGPVRVRLALADSLNIPAVRVLSMVGVQPFLERLRALGFNHLNRTPDYYGLGLTLGGGEVSLWELTRAYVALEHDGHSIDLVTTMDSQPRQSPAPIGEPASWELVADILGDSHARAKAFGVDSVLDMPFPAVVKTGTSSDFRDTWTVGFSSDYTVGVWVGNFNGDPMRSVSGVTGAAPLWNRIMLHLHEEREPQPFPAPRGLRLEPICATTGLRPRSDCAAVVYEYLYPQDMAAYLEPPAASTLPREYDEWMAHQDMAQPQVRILFPHDGDVFVRYPNQGAFAAQLQALELRAAVAPGEHVSWWLNGQKINSQRLGAAFWPLRAGTWTLRVQNKTKSDTVTFVVIAGKTRVLRRGFSLAL
ncbi:MAG TPA: penicillin-binding protein 1C, partial [Candidatus Eremiobacteraceae bacterium]|nr:penicillin-binding protein 1C [Candidatus Eremiobacteraceae bacterium]